MTEATTLTPVPAPHWAGMDKAQLADPLVRALDEGRDVLLVGIEDAADLRGLAAKAGVECVVRAAERPGEWIVRKHESPTARAWKIAVAGGTPDEIEAADPHFFQDLATVELDADLIEAHGEAA